MNHNSFSQYPLVYSIIITMLYFRVVTAMHVCQYCDRSYRTNRGLHQHMSRSCDKKERQHCSTDDCVSRRNQRIFLLPGTQVPQVFLIVFLYFQLVFCFFYRKPTAPLLKYCGEWLTATTAFGTKLAIRSGNLNCCTLPCRI